MLSDPGFFQGVILCITRIGKQRATTSMFEDLKKSALDYHRHPRPGKLEIKATKSLANQRDLALAYSPGVAFACRGIENNPFTLLYSGKAWIRPPARVPAGTRQR